MKEPLKMPRLSKRATLIREYESLAECRVKRLMSAFASTMRIALRMTLIMHIGRVSCVEGIAVLFMRPISAMGLQLGMDVGRWYVHDT